MSGTDDPELPAPEEPVRAATDEPSISPEPELDEDAMRAGRFR